MKPRQTFIVLAFSLVACLAAPSGEAVPIKNEHLENAHRVTDNLVVGAEPHDEEAFKALKNLGIKTLISVDGAKPDAELAQKYGMRYVHLPIGYDQVPTLRSKELAKAITELDGPIYMHCHHGKHRAPAAAVSACVVANSLSNDEAVAIMKKMGSGENYLGLWESAKTAKAAGAEELKQLKVDFRPAMPIPPLAEAMVNIDAAFDHLADCQESGWKAPAKHPDLDPAHEALKLREIYAEILRTDAHKKRPTVHQKWMLHSAELSKTLERQLRDRADENNLNATFAALQNDCKTCHKIYRNVKQK